MGMLDNIKKAASKYVEGFSSWLRDSLNNEKSTPETPLSYEEFLAQNPKLLGETRDKAIEYWDTYEKNELETLEKNRDSAYSTALAAKNDAYKKADVTRENEIIDSNSAYEQNKATYGANAEALARMGLTGGGYSEYLDSKAYAQQRADVQAANAKSSKAKGDADYAEFLARQSADSAYNDSRLSVVNTASKGRLDAEGAYSEGIAQNNLLAAQYAENLKTNATDAFYAAITDIAKGVYNSKGQIEELASAYNMSAEQKTALVESYQKFRYDMFVSDISMGSFDQKAIDSAFATEDISPEHYESLKKLWNDNIDVSESTFVKEDGTKMTSEEAKKIIDEILKNPWVSEDTKNAINSAFKDAYDNSSLMNKITQGLEDRKNQFSIENSKSDASTTSGTSSSKSSVSQIMAGYRDYVNGYSAFQQVQSFIDSNGLREGDRNRWGQAFKVAGILDLFNSLTAEEKAALKGKI